MLGETEARRWNALGLAIHQADTAFRAARRRREDGEDGWREQLAEVKRLLRAGDAQRRNLETAKE